MWNYSYILKLKQTSGILLPFLVSHTTLGQVSKASHPFPRLLTKATSGGPCWALEPTEHWSSCFITKEMQNIVLAFKEHKI